MTTLSVIKGLRVRYDHKRLMTVAYLSLALIIAACRPRSNDDRLASMRGDGYLPSFFMSERLTQAPNECISNFANVSTDALADGLLMNGALTGLGTNTTVGPRLATDSFYFQALRIFSIFDWRFSEVLREQRVTCLPEKFAFGMAYLPQSYTGGLPQPYQEDAKKLRETLKAISRDASDFAAVEVDAIYKPQRWPNTPAGNNEFRKQVSDGALSRLAMIRRDAERTDDLKVRLKGMAAAFAPLTASYNAEFPTTLAQGKAYIEALLPPLYDLEIKDFDKPKTWKLTRGMKKVELPRVVDISIAKLTHIGHLSNLPDSDEPVIKFQFFKEFEYPDKVVMRIVFGKVSPQGSEAGYLPMEYRDYRSALFVSFFPNLEIKPEDSGVIQRAKQEFNQLANVIRVDARIHQLTVELQRKPGKNPLRDGVDSLILTPHFSMRDSDISFRVYLDPNSPTGRQHLEAAGFVCQGSDDARAECYRDLGAFEEFSKYFSDEENGLASMSGNSGWAGRFRSALNVLIRYNTKFLINWNMGAIEKAIDAQFVEIFSAFADRQLDARSKIAERLEREIFAKRH